MSPAAFARSEPPRGAEPAEGPLARLLRDRALRTVFQPIANLRDGVIYAHEALIRGPQSMPLHSPDALFAAARREGILERFELACVDIALRRWAALEQPGRLFVNISAAALLAAVRMRSVAGLVASIDELGLLPRMITFEITEHEHVTDVKEFVDAALDVQTRGLSFALDDFGDGRSSLRLWSELGPDIVKIDKYFTHGISSRARKLQTLRALMQIAEVFGTTLIAEGIETADELRAIRDLGIDLGQGFLLGRPDGLPRLEIGGPAASVLVDKRVAVLPTLRSAASPTRLRALNVVDADPIAPTATNDEVAELFFRHPAWPALAVVDDGTPKAIVERHQFLDRYAKSFFKEVYGKKPCLAFANTAPRVLERDQDIGELIGILTSSDQRYLTDGFIVTENGRYFGIGTADQLVRNVTESRIEAARHANPLTFLPGNIPISEHIARLLSSGADFVVCYADLSDFKPFNDRYGYWRGDEMIKLVAGTALAHTDPRRDFIGHVGGDDFVFVFQDEAWKARCLEIVAAFNQAALKLYDADALAAGGIVSEDRHGVTRFFPHATLYMGALVARAGSFNDAEQVASAAAQAKRRAKLSGVGVLVSDGRTKSRTAEPSRKSETVTEPVIS